MFTEVEVLLGEIRPVGVEGAVTSGPGAALLTVTVMVVAVVVLPAASRAIAVSV
jgi:hypothetical protein